METRVERPPIRKVLVQLVVVGAWTTALIVIDKTTGDGVAVVVSVLGYAGYIAWFFWSRRHQ